MPVAVALVNKVLALLTTSLCDVFLLFVDLHLFCHIFWFVFTWFSAAAEQMNCIVSYRCWRRRL